MDTWLEGGEAGSQGIGDGAETRFDIVFGKGVEAELSVLVGGLKVGGDLVEGAAEAGVVVAVHVLPLGGEGGGKVLPFSHSPCHWHRFYLRQIQEERFRYRGELGLGMYVLLSPSEAGVSAGVHTSHRCVALKKGCDKCWVDMMDC